MISIVISMVITIACGVSYLRYGNGDKASRSDVPVRHDTFRIGSLYGLT